MSGCKHSIWKTLSAGAALFLLLPSLALGEIGVCPPYSKTFGPGDPWSDIEAFLLAANSRPGGGTLKLVPGFGLPETLVTSVITGVVCIEGLPESAESRVALAGVLFDVYDGGLLTLRSVRVGSQGPTTIAVRTGGNLFASNIETPNSEDDPSANGLCLSVDYGGFVQVQNSKLCASRNHGVMLLERCQIGAYCNFFTVGVPVGIDNSGYLLLSNANVHGRNDKYCGRPYSGGIWNQASGVVTMVGSTIAKNLASSENSSFGGIYNEGHLEIARSIVADNTATSEEDPDDWIPADCVGIPAIDLGYNVFGVDGGCQATTSTSIEADPLFSGGLLPFELESGSPAIDLIPLELCSETDGLGRARTDGDGDGVIACDAGALEYGYGFIEATVRARPYHWREVGTIDLSVTDLMTIYVFSTETVDATQIVFSTVEIEDFDPDAKGWPWTIDVGRDGLVDYQVTWWLNRQSPLPCGYQEHEFTAMTEDGREVRGLLKFNAVGCTP